MFRVDRRSTAAFTPNGSSTSRLIRGLMAEFYAEAAGRQLMPDQPPSSLPPTGSSSRPIRANVAPITPADVAIDTVRAPMQSTGWLRAIRPFVSGSFPAFSELCGVHFCYQSMQASLFAIVPEGLIPPSEPVSWAAILLMVLQTSG